MNHQVVRRIVEHAIRLHEQLFQCFRKILKHVRRRVFESGLVPLRQDPGFEREAWCIGSKGQKVFVLRNHANAVIDFLSDDVAEHAALFVDVVLLGSLNFFHDINRQNRQRNQLGMRVLQ